MLFRTCTEDCDLTGKLSVSLLIEIIHHHLFMFHLRIQINWFKPQLYAQRATARLGYRLLRVLALMYCTRSTSSSVLASMYIKNHSGDCTSITLYVNNTLCHPLAPSPEKGTEVTLYISNDPFAATIFSSPSLS
jgi:hypothetical protein